MKVKKVYVLLTDTGTLFTRMIKLYTKNPYNHASISFDPNLSEVYSFGRKYNRNPFIGGFVKEDTQAELFKQAKCAIYSCTVTDKQLHRMNHYIQKIEKQKDLYRYNFLGLFGVMLNKQINRENAFFCSQFVATVLMESDITRYQKPLSLMTPYDLQNSPEFQLVYQGRFKDFTEVQRDIEITVPQLSVI